MLRATVQHIARAAGDQRRAWAAMAEAGLVGIAVPEALGGAGLGLAEQVVLVEALGADLAAMVYPTIALGLPLLAADRGGHHAGLLTATIAGKVRLAAALTERGGRYDPSLIETRAVWRADRWVLDGMKSVVFGGDCADALIVSAQTGSAPQDIALFVVPAATAGLSRQSFATLGQGSAADLVLDAVEVPAAHRLDLPGGALATIGEALNGAVAMQCAEGLAILRDMLDETAAYLELRQQFGRPLREFQALQHRFADMTIAFELYQPMLGHVLDLSRQGGAPFSRAVSAAKVALIQAAHTVGRGAIQLHGGIGLTQDLPLSRGFRRLVELEFALGDMPHHRRHAHEPVPCEGPGDAINQAGAVGAPRYI